MYISPYDNIKTGYFDTRFGTLGDYTIGRCIKTGIDHTIPQVSEEELKLLYEKFYGFGGENKTIYVKLRKRFFLSSFYRIWMAIDGDICFHSLKGDGLLMDIGCGEGRGLAIYQRNGFKVEGLEINERAAIEARTDGFEVYTIRLENYQLNNLYDVVVLSNVLEHSLSPEEMLNHVNRILKIGGQIWISCPNVDSWQEKLFGRYWINWHVPFHIVHFSQNTLINILQETGFEIQEMRQKSPALWVAQSLIVKLFAKPGKPTNHLRRSLLVVSLMLLTRGLLFPLLWLGNLLGRGDCLIIEAKKKQAI